MHHMKIYILIICSSISLQKLYASYDIETTKERIMQILQQQDTASIVTFRNFFYRYDQLVVNLFDMQNTDSLKTHIACMEQELEVLQQTVHNPKYRAIQPLLVPLQKDVTTMTQILKENANSNALNLGLRIQSYDHLLPATVKQRRLISLFWALQHRLNCKDA